MVVDSSSPGRCCRRPGQHDRCCQRAPPLACHTPPRSAPCWPPSCAQARGHAAPPAPYTHPVGETTNQVSLPPMSSSTLVTSASPWTSGLLNNSITVLTSVERWSAQQQHFTSVERTRSASFLSTIQQPSYHHLYAQGHHRSLHPKLCSATRVRKCTAGTTCCGERLCASGVVRRMA